MTNDTGRWTDAHTRSHTRRQRVWFRHFALVTGPCCLKNDDGLEGGQNNIFQIAAGNSFIMKVIVLEEDHFSK